MKVSRLVIFGDSISTVNFSGGGYEKLLCDSLGCTEVENHATNAAALTLTYPYSALQSIKDAPGEAGVDAVILWAGTNDWFYGVPLDEFNASLKLIPVLLEEKYPYAEYIICTPIWRFSEREETQTHTVADITPNKAGLTLSDYRYAILHSGLEHICDMNAYLGVNMQNNTTLLRDGVHPTRCGYEAISRILCEYIKNL